MSDDVKRSGRTSRSEFLTGMAAGLVIPLATLAGCCKPADGRSEKAVADATEALRHTDPTLLRYREGAKLATGHQAARAIALGPDGVVYCAGDRAVTRQRNGKLDGVPVSGEPQAIDVAPDGRMVVGMMDHVVILAADGHGTATWPSIGPNAQITAVSAGKGGVWVADSGGKQVLAYDWNGKLRGTLGKRDASTGYPGLDVPSPHLDVVATDDKVFVTNPGLHRVEVYSPDGLLRSTWGEPANDLKGFCGCCNPTDIALLPDGRFVTAEKGIPRVKLCAADGKFQGVVAGPESFASATKGLDLAVGPTGRVFVLDSRANTIRVFEPLA